MGTFTSLVTKLCTCVKMGQAVTISMRKVNWVRERGLLLLWNIISSSDISKGAASIYRSLYIDDVSSGHTPLFVSCHLAEAW